MIDFGVFGQQGLLNKSEINVDSLFSLTVFPHSKILTLIVNIPPASHPLPLLLLLPLLCHGAVPPRRLTSLPAISSHTWRRSHTSYTLGPGNKNALTHLIDLIRRACCEENNLENESAAQH